MTFETAEWVLAFRFSMAVSSGHDTRADMQALGHQMSNLLVASAEHATTRFVMFGKRLADT